jgi:hypothetical protein
MAGRQREGCALPAGQKYSGSVRANQSARITSARGGVGDPLQYNYQSVAGVGAPACCVKELLCLLDISLAINSSEMLLADFNGCGWACAFPRRFCC